MKHVSRLLLLPCLIACSPAQHPASTTPAVAPAEATPSSSPQSVTEPAAANADRVDLAPGACQDAEAPFPEGTDQIDGRRALLTWHPCPTAISKDCEMAVLEGNPKDPGLFTLRIRSKSPFKLPVHRHPRHERVTVLEGSIHVAFGDTFDETKGKEFSQGDYYVNRAGVPHTVWTTGPVTGQITGFGPWVVEPLSGSAE